MIKILQHDTDIISMLPLFMMSDPFEVLEKQRLRLATVTEEDLITTAAIHLRDSACQGLLVWLKYTPGMTASIHTTA
jgi:hypothetical protein